MRSSRREEAPSIVLKVAATFTATSQTIHKVGRATPCAPQTASGQRNGAHGVTRPTISPCVWSALLFVALTLTACTKKPAAPAAQDFRLFFTCDIRGRLVPCGCFTGQYGGMTRLKTVLDGDTSTNSLRVDIGDALAGPEDFQVIQHRYILRAFADLRYDALNLGHREAQLSAAQLRALRTNSTVPIFSANLLDRKTGAPLFDTHRLVKRGPHTLALVGVMDPRVPADSLGDGLAIEKMETVLGRLLPQLKKQADAIVLLAFTDEATLAKLAQEFYELDIVLGGKVSQPAQKLERENKSLIYYTSNEGRALGLLELRLAGRGQLTATKNDIVLLHDRIPQAEPLQAINAAYRDEIRRTKLAVDDPARLQENMVPGVRQTVSFAGSESCAKCHATAFKAWKSSSHADAFATLVHEKADADPNCIGCHTVGFGTPSGYRREFARAKLVDVGCESCHGPGSQHVAQYESGGAVTFKFRPLGAGDCQKCHHGEFSRPFVWEKFWPKVAHGKEPAKARGEAMRKARELIASKNRR